VLASALVGVTNHYEVIWTCGVIIDVKNCVSEDFYGVFGFITVRTPQVQTPEMGPEMGTELVLFC